MYKIGVNAINASKNNINTKLKNKVLNTYINLIKKNKKKIIIPKKIKKTIRLMPDVKTKLNQVKKTNKV